ncbi:MAG TPA: helix-turn-helix domain-containing protein, partial [Candidatus Limnocylindrales bacterium]|nr:helix-turn-helix domain-containing protein [Candidatus Limnocylindrales bacterium]
LTQQQLASRVAVTQPTISKLETGQTQGMRFRTLCRLVGILQIGEEYRFPDGPPPATRRLPGSQDGAQPGPAAGRRASPRR